MSHEFTNKSEFTLTFLNIKLLGKIIEEKLHFNNIVSIKSMFLEIELYKKRNLTLVKTLG